MDVNLVPAKIAALNNRCSVIGPSTRIALTAANATGRQQARLHPRLNGDELGPFQKQPQGRLTDAGTIQPHVIMQCREEPSLGHETSPWGEMAGWAIVQTAGVWLSGIGVYQTSISL